VCALAALASSRGGALGQRARPAPTAAVHNLPYEGRFTVARLTYTTATGGFYYFGLPAWAHGYPHAELNLMSILNEISSLPVHRDGSNAYALDDPDLCKYPVAFMTEAGYWQMNDQEAEGLRRYFEKGGFVIFDDFRDDFRNRAGWDNFVRQMARVLPGARFLDLTPDDPIFHSFFEIRSFDIVPQFYDQNRPVFKAIYEDNDPKKRMMAIVNFNTDVSNFWEFNAQGLVPIDLENEAYKLGVNYVMYGLTH
jgi:hypothetical protein